ncbi:MAG: hypothetical protein HY722_00215 [Planctomycetes bacterium]|nr:hypothetical protein [Planctomycetota bacterium]
MRKRWTAALAAALALPVLLEARTKLVTLPGREATWVHLDNPGSTLVEEERTLALQRGTNQVDFSWNGVHLDPDSIRLTVLDHREEVNLISVRYPPAEQALIWEIFAARGASVRVRIAYLLAGIDRLVEYRGTLTKDEARLDLDAYMVLRNFSGEDFQDARLILGQGEAFERESRHEETRKALFATHAALPVVKVLVWDAAALPWEPDREESNVGVPFQYRLTNTTEGGLGKQLLWNGKVRVHQQDGHGSTLFLGEDHAGLTPVGEELRLGMGESRDVVVTQKREREERINLRRNRAGGVVLYDTDEAMTVKVENFKDGPAVVEVVEHVEGQWEMESSSHEFRREDHRTLVYTLALAPRETQTIAFRYHRKNVR